jgi:hypothetical protein
MTSAQWAGTWKSGKFDPLQIALILFLLKVEKKSSSTKEKSSQKLNSLKSHASLNLGKLSRNNISPAKIGK